MTTVSWRRCLEDVKQDENHRTQDTPSGIKDAAQARCD